MALMAITDTVCPRLSKGRPCLRVYDDFTAIRSPGRMDRTTSRCLSS